MLERFDKFKKVHAFEVFDETPALRAHLFEMFEGRQIARIDLDRTPNPYGGPSLCFETTIQGRHIGRLAIMACPDLTENVPAPWILRPVLFEDPNLIITRSMIRRLRMDRKSAGEGEPGWLQERVEGQVIARAYLLPEISEFGGEKLLMDFTSGDALLVVGWPPGGGYTANLQMSFVPKTRIISPISRP